jgi:hypothetical protein
MEFFFKSFSGVAKASSKQFFPELLILTYHPYFFNDDLITVVPANHEIAPKGIISLS